MTEINEQPKIRRQSHFHKNLMEVTIKNYKKINRLYWKISKSVKLVENDKIQKIKKKLNISEKTIYRSFLIDPAISIYRAEQFNKYKQINKKTPDLNALKLWLRQEKEGNKNRHTKCKKIRV